MKPGESHQVADSTRGRVSPLTPEQIDAAIEAGVARAVRIGYRRWVQLVLLDPDGPETLDLESRPETTFTIQGPPLGGLLELLIETDRLSLDFEIDDDDDDDDDREDAS
ncbi:MAG: hypothetical protein V3U03_17405 [Myxococcota bacterium]